MRRSMVTAYAKVVRALGVFDWYVPYSIVEAVPGCLNGDPLQRKDPSMPPAPPPTVFNA